MKLEGTLCWLSASLRIFERDRKVEDVSLNYCQSCCSSIVETKDFGANECSALVRVISKTNHFE